MAAIGPTTFGVVLDVLARGVTGPAVADHGAATGDRSRDEAAQARGRIVLDYRQPDLARSLAHDLDRARDQELAFVRAPGLGHDRCFLGAKGQAGLVDLDLGRSVIPSPTTATPTTSHSRAPVSTG
jgi:hypothetical protein